MEKNKNMNLIDWKTSPDIIIADLRANIQNINITPSNTMEKAKKFEININNSKKGAVNV
ncbi:MAG: hypothetical protein KAQ99_08780 [Candidatus Aureabacteria bacterium]|nr:hypothetical protein [Candidatus Auribacterota bacterium]